MLYYSMDYYFIRPCRTSAAYEAVPRSYAKLDLKKVRDNLMKQGYDVTDARMFLIVKKEVEINIYKSGRLIIRTDDKLFAEKIAEELYPILKIEN